MLKHRTILFAAVLIFATSIYGPRLLAAAVELNRALMEASATRDPERIRKLLADGADPNFEDASGVTPLINAAARGNNRSIRLLLDAGARIDEDGDNGCSALTWAARNGWDKTTEILLDRGATIDHRDKGELTPLMRAAWNGQRNVVELLLRRGADVSARDRFGNTALAFAFAGRNKIIQGLVRAADRGASQVDALRASTRIAEQPFVSCVELAATR